MGKYAKEADGYRRNGEWIDAGDYYSSAGYAYMGELPPKILTNGSDLRNFMYAALCYRIGGEMRRCKTRCRMAILRAEETKRLVLKREKIELNRDLARLGKWSECIGDLRVVGELGREEEAYQEAEKKYREDNDPRVDEGFEKPHNQVENYLYDIAYAAGYDMEKYNERYGAWEQTYSSWLDFKREHLPKFVDEIANKKEFSMPRDEDV